MLKLKNIGQLLTDSFHIFKNFGVTHKRPCRHSDFFNKFRVKKAVFSCKRAHSRSLVINNFNFIDEVLIWVFFTEDIKNENIRVSARSRGPIINEILSHYNGGGHKYASGARVKTFEETDLIIKEFDDISREFKKEKCSSGSFPRKPAANVHYGEGWFCRFGRKREFCR